MTPAADMVKAFQGRHAMVSFEEPRQIEEAAEVCQSVALDNGAFSAWRQGKPHDFAGYVEWAAHWLKHPVVDWAVIPDVIGVDDPGQCASENDVLLHQWPLGTRGVPVWHLHEPLERLQRLCKRWPRIALGSSGRYSDPGSKAWWGAKEGGDGFYSGGGSHDPSIVEGYITAVTDWISSLGKPDVVDLGCGDFAVGSKLRHLCGNYTACDVVQPLIDRNRQLYKGLDVDFRVVDLIADELPAGRVAFVRQVLQHLSNQAISAIITKLQGKYDYLVVTNQSRSRAEVKENKDMPIGPGWREVTLTAEPFNLRAHEARVLCEIVDRYTGGVIRTTAYRLRELVDAEVT